MDLEGFNSGRESRYEYYKYESNENKSDSDNENEDDPTNDRHITDTNEDDDDDDDDEFSYKSFNFTQLFRFAGPGWLMSIAYIDCGNLESDIQSGAIAGYSMIWILFWSTIVGWAIQVLCIRLTLVTKYNLAQLCRYEYSKRTSLILWVCIECGIIATDILQVIGSAIAFKVLFGINLWIGCVLTAFTAFGLLTLNNLFPLTGSKCLEYSFLFLISIMCVCFVIECIISQPSFTSILYGWFVPYLNNVSDDEVQEQSIGTIGSVIMPYNLFLHSALIQMKGNMSGNNGGNVGVNRKKIKKANFYFGVESAISLMISFFINLCILSVFAKAFYNNSNYRASDVGLMTAASFLRSKFGDIAVYAWAIGLLAAGQAATMTGTIAGQYVMNGFLNLQWNKWKRTMVTRSIALVPSLIVAILASKQFDVMGKWLNISQCVILPFALLPLLFFNFNSRIMGNEFVLSLKWKVFFGLVALTIIICNVYLIIDFISDWDTSLIGVKYSILISFLVLYLALISYLIYDFMVQMFNDNQMGAIDDDQKQNFKETVPLLQTK